jgi:hypothetical protein
MSAPAEIKKCGGTGNHIGWKRGFLLIGGVWRCRVCKEVCHA